MEKLVITSDGHRLLIAIPGGRRWCIPNCTDLTALIADFEAWLPGCVALPEILSVEEADKQLAEYTLQLLPGNSLQAGAPLRPEQEREYDRRIVQCRAARDAANRKQTEVADAIPKHEVARAWVPDETKCGWSTVDHRWLVGDDLYLGHPLRPLRLRPVSVSHPALIQEATARDQIREVFGAELVEARKLWDTLKAARSAGV